MVLGFVLVFYPGALTRGVHLGTTPTWRDLTFAMPIAMLAFTGIETVANFAEEAREPRPVKSRGDARRDRAETIVYVVIATRPPFGVSRAGTPAAARIDWLRAPLVGIVLAVGYAPGDVAGETLRVSSASPGRVILAATRSRRRSRARRGWSYSLGGTKPAPAIFSGRLRRRPPSCSPASVVAGAVFRSPLFLIVATSFTRTVPWASPRSTRLRHPVAFTAVRGSPSSCCASASRPSPARSGCRSASSSAGRGCR